MGYTQVSTLICKYSVLQPISELSGHNYGAVGTLGLNLRCCRRYFVSLRLAFHTVHYLELLYIGFLSFSVFLSLVSRLTFDHVIFARPPESQDYEPIP